MTVPVSIENDRPLAAAAANPFDREISLYEKSRRSGDIQALVAVPDPYRTALPNLGHQMIEHTINRQDGFFASRCYLADDFSLLRETAGAPAIVFLSMSYEGSYIRALQILDLLGIPIRARDRNAGDPLVVVGGRAVSMNPLPFWNIADLIGIGDGLAIIETICRAFMAHSDREAFYDAVAGRAGIAVPRRYRVATRDGALTQWEARGAPEHIEPNRENHLPHSWYLSPETDYNDAGYYDEKTFFSIEIVRACASRCAFCAEGWNNGTVRALSDPAALTAVGLWGRARGADLFKLFFPANSGLEPAKAILRALRDAGLLARVGSAKAERLDRAYVDLVAGFGQEKFALAPETAAYALRKKLGKPGMTDAVLYKVAGWAVAAGIPNLDFYFIANLPGEREGHLQQTIDWIGAMHDYLERQGMAGSMRVSIPNFFPKAWTPFQYAAAGGIGAYEHAVGAIRSAIDGNIRFSTMLGQTDLLSQTLCSRGGPEIGEVMLGVHRLQKQAAGFTSDTIEMWRSAMADLRINEADYFRARSVQTPMPWQNIRNDRRSTLAQIQRTWTVFQDKTSADMTGASHVS